MVSTLVFAEADGQQSHHLGDDLLVGHRSELGIGRELGWHVRPGIRGHLEGLAGRDAVHGLCLCLRVVAREVSHIFLLLRFRIGMGSEVLDQILALDLQLDCVALLEVLISHLECLVVGVKPDAGEPGALTDLADVDGVHSYPPYMELYDRDRVGFGYIVGVAVSVGEQPGGASLLRLLTQVTWSRRPHRTVVRYRNHRLVRRPSCIRKAPCCS